MLKNFEFLGNSKIRVFSQHWLPGYCIIHLAKEYLTTVIAPNEAVVHLEVLPDVEITGNKET